MRILYVGLLPPEKGGYFVCGTAIHGWELARQACDHDHEVYFLAPSRPGFPDLIDGIKIVRMPDTKWLKYLRAVRSLPFLGWRYRFARSLPLKEKIAFAARCRFLDKVLPAVSPQVVHVHGRENPWSLSVRALSDSIPLVISHHGFSAASAQEKDLQKARSILGCADRLVLVSSSLLRRDQELLEDLHERVVVINNPIDSGRVPLMDKHQAKRRLGLDDRKVIFFSGICDSLNMKGLRTLLDSYAGSISLKQSCRLIMIADPEGMQHASRFLSEKRIAGIVMGPQPREKLAALYNAADVFVMPSRSEAFPLVFLESLLAGVPVVGYQNSVEELADLLGIYVGEPFDASRESLEDLASKIIKALQVDADRNLIRQSIIDSLSWDLSFPKYDDIYKDLVGRSHVIDQMYA
jgi:glycosyltransferase involved in cell wall biosynthesis